MTEIRQRQQQAEQPQHAVRVRPDRRPAAAPEPPTARKQARAVGRAVTRQAAGATRDG